MGNCGNTQRYASSSNSPSDADSQQLTDGRCLHQGSILGLGYAEGQLYTCSDDKSIGKLSVDKLCRDKHYEGVYFKGHEKAVNRLVMSAKNRLWSASRDLSVRLWDTDSGSCLCHIEKAHSLNVSALASPQGAFNHWVFSGSRDYSVKGWDVVTGENVCTFTCPRNIVTTMACRSADSHLLYQGSEDLSVRVWDIRSADSQPSMHLTGYVYFPLCMSLQESGHLLATGTKGFNAVGCGVMLWDLRNTSKPLHELKGHTQDVTGCSFLPGNQDTIISACKDGSVFVWDVNALQTSKSFQFPKKWISSLQVFEDFPLSSLAMSDPQNQAQFAIGSLDGSVSMMSFDKNDAQQPLKVHFSSKAMLDGDDADSTA